MIFTSQIFISALSAVIRIKNYDGIFFKSQSFKRFHNFANIRIHTFNHGGISCIIVSSVWTFLFVFFYKMLWSLKRRMRSVLRQVYIKSLIFIVGNEINVISVFLFFILFSYI